MQIYVFDVFAMASLVNNSTNVCFFRYTDEIEEDLENSDLGRVSGKPIFAMSESIADQEEIMEL